MNADYQTYLSFVFNDELFKNFWTDVPVCLQILTHNGMLFIVYAYDVPYENWLFLLCL